MMSDYSVPFAVILLVTSTAAGSPNLPLVDPPTDSEAPKPLPIVVTVAVPNSDMAAIISMDDPVYELFTMANGGPFIPWHYTTSGFADNNGSAGPAIDTNEIIASITGGADKITGPEWTATLGTMPHSRHLAPSITPGPNTPGSNTLNTNTPDPDTTADSPSPNADTPSDNPLPETNIASNEPPLDAQVPPYDPMPEANVPRYSAPEEVNAPTSDPDKIITPDSNSGPKEEFAELPSLDDPMGPPDIDIPAATEPVINAVPAPPMLSLLSLGLLTMVGLRRKSRL